MADVDTVDDAIETLDTLRPAITRVLAERVAAHRARANTAASNSAAAMKALANERKAMESRRTLTAGEASAMLKAHEEKIAQLVGE